jgi:hypothetical protein
MFRDAKIKMELWLDCIFDCSKVELVLIFKIFYYICDCDIIVYSYVLCTGTYYFMRLRLVVTMLMET